MRRSLVGFESPNFGHAFLDGFEDLYNSNREREEYGDFGDDEPHPPPSSSSRNTTTSTANRGGLRVQFMNNPTTAQNRGRPLHISDGSIMRPHTGMMGLRELPTSDKRGKDSQLADTPPSYAHAFLGEPEPSLDDLLVAPPPEWTLCCVCHEIFKQPTSTLCGHTFCYDCIVEVINRKGTCPLCRHPIGFNEITENKQAMQAISELMVRCKYGLCLVSQPSRPIISSSFSIPSPFPAASSSPYSSVPSSSSTPFSSVPSSSSSAPFAPSSFPLPPHVATSSTHPHTFTPSSSSSSSSSSSPWASSHPSSSSSHPSSSSPSSSSSSHPPRINSSPIAIRSPTTSLPDHAPTQARSLPSSLPSFMRTAAEWAIALNGCTATFALSQYGAHEAICPHRPIACYNDGCKEKIKSKDLEAHMESCKHRVIQCPDCREMLLFSDEESHSQSCLEKEVGCPHKCNQKVRRKEKDNHISVCTNVEITCVHAQYGCSFRGLRAVHEEHVSSCAFKALASVLGNLTQQVAHLTLANQNQAHTVTMLQQEIKTLHTQVREQAAEIRTLREARNSRFLHDPFE